MRKIKKNDEVIVLTGADKGACGKILKVVDAGKRVIVEGVHVIKKHVKPNPNKNQAGGILEREAPIPMQNVAIFNRLTNKKDKVCFKILEGKMVRYFKSTGELIDIV